MTEMKTDFLEEKSTTDADSSKDKENEVLVSRRGALLGALFGVGAAIAKSASASDSCSCLAPPDCSSVCANGGAPKGDGTQSCECFTNPKQTFATVATTGQYTDLTNRPSLATVATTGKYSDLTGKPTIPSAVYPPTTTTAGSFGPTANVTINRGETKSIAIPYFTVNAQGQVTAKGSYTLTVTPGVLSYYYNYDDYYNTGCNCGDDSGCFIAGKLLTKDGYKSVENIQINDILIGDDGEHKVLGIATATLGKSRFAISPANDDKLVLTADHVIYENGSPVIADSKFLPLNRKVLTSETANGCYDYPELISTCKASAESFVKRTEFSPETKTYTFIVDGGLWGRSEGGTKTLLARKVNALALEESDSKSALPSEAKKVVSRREALLGALFGAGVAVAKTASAADAACACLAPPDCDSICPNGGAPRGDGTQACDCFDNPKQDVATVATTGSYTDLSNRPSLATVATTGKYSDLLNKPTIPSQKSLGSVTSAGTVGQTSNKSIGANSSGSVSIPYFTVNSYGQITSRGNCTLTVYTGPATAYYNYGNHYNYSNNCCNCGDDSGCFIAGKLLTKDGYKSVENIQINDILIGDDGEHKVLGIATATLGKSRFAISPANDDKLVLTADHVIYENGSPVIVDSKYLELNRKVLTSATAKGCYDYPELLSTCKARAESFVKRTEIPPETKTYTFIVNGGLWGLSEGGTKVLLARKVNSDLP